MQMILQRLIDKINKAKIDPEPSDNIYMEDVFPPSVYTEILSKLPTDDEYDFIQHPDAILADGRKTRKLLDLTDFTIGKLKPTHQEFWQTLREVLTSEILQKVLMQKFYHKIKHRFNHPWPELVSVPLLYRDFPGYRINAHTDAPFKVITLQFYFPKDESQIHLGTSFLQKNNEEFNIIKTNLFKPNSAYAFARTDTSWHCVKEIPAQESRRDSLALTIYLKGHEYQSGY